MTRRIFIPDEGEVRALSQATKWAEEQLKRSERIVLAERLRDGWAFTVEGNGDDTGYG